MFAVPLFFCAMVEQIRQAQSRVLSCARSQRASFFLFSHCVWVLGSSLGQLASTTFALRCPLTDIVFSFFQAVHMFVVSGSHVTQLYEFINVGNRPGM